MNKVSQSALARYSVAALAVAAALGIRLLLDRYLLDRVPYISFFLAIVVAAWHGGRGPSLFAVLFGYLAATWFIVAPRGSFIVHGLPDIAGAGTFLVVGTAIAFFGGSLREAERRAELHAADVARGAAERRQAEASLRLTLEAARMGEWRLDIATDELVLSDRVSAIFGLPASPLTFTSIRQVIHPEDRERVREEVERSIAEKTDYDIEHRVIWPDKTVHWVSARGCAIYDASGKPLTMIGVAALIDERKHAQEAKLEAQERFRVTLASIGDAVIVTDAESRVTYMNPVAKQLTGWGEESYGGDLSAVFRILNESTRLPVEIPVARVLREGVVVGLANHTVLLSKDGREVPIDDSAAPVRNDRGEITGVVLTFRDVSGPRQAEAKLRAGEELLRSVIDHSPSMIFLKDREGRYLLANRSCEALVGAGPGEFIGKTDADYFPAADSARTKVDDQRVFEGGVAQQWEETVGFPAGDRTFLTVKFPVPGPKGDLIALCGIATEITERKRLEADLHKLVAVIETSTDIIVIAAVDGKIDYFNDAGLKLLGIDSLEEARKKTLWDFVPEGGDAFVRDGLIPTLHREGRWEGEGPYRNLKTGEAIPFSKKIALLRDPRTGEPTAYAAVSRDIRERKRAEEALQFLSEASVAVAQLLDWESTLGNVARLAVPYFADLCVMDVVAEDGSIHRVATAHVDPEQERLFKKLFERYPTRWDSASAVVQVLRSRQPAITPRVSDELLEAIAQDPEHLRLLHELTLRSTLCVPILVRDRVIGALGFARADGRQRFGDADLPLAEEVSRRASVALENARLYREVQEADRRKDEFLAMLAHELRNPLAPISNALQLLKRPLLSQEQLGPIQEMMERQVRQLVRLVDDLLDVSRITRGKIKLQRETLEIAAVVQAAVETSRPLIDARAHTLLVTLPDEPLRMVGDGSRLAQVIANLLNNAAKYTEPGGRIWISVERDGDELLLRVKDTGVGIPAAMRSKIFDLFTQVEGSLDRSQGGLGIGLTLVKRLVEMHSGSVQAQSPGQGQGSEFIVRLPVLPRVAAPVHPGAQAGAAEKPRAAHRILVVDDNVDSAETLALLLEFAGHKVATAFSGPAALSVASKFQPWVVFLDIGLPGMDGYEVARRLRELPSAAGMLLVAMTGYGQDSDRRRSAEAGFDHHLVKPVDPAEMEALLEGAPARGPLHLPE